MLYVTVQIAVITLQMYLQKNVFFLEYFQSVYYNVGKGNNARWKHFYRRRYASRVEERIKRSGKESENN